MNNRQPGRRRGRNTNNNNNNNRNQGNRGGVDRDNRIDNRARGNAAQMLEKYKKMAQDAQVNDDRVNAEYYHQFADHYFRVNADTQARREEQRQARDEHRGPNNDRNDNRDDNRRDGDEQEDRDNQDRSPRSRQQNDRRPKAIDSRNGQHGEDDRSEEHSDDHRDDQRDDVISSDAGNGGGDAEVAAEKKPVRARRPRTPSAQAAEGKPARTTSAKAKTTGSNGESNGFDVSILPPAIAIQPDDGCDDNDIGNETAEDAGEIQKKPVVRKRRTVKAKETQEGGSAA